MQAFRCLPLHSLAWTWILHHQDRVLQLMNLLHRFQAVMEHAGGPDALARLLTCTLVASQAAGGSEKLVSLLKAVSQLIAQFENTQNVLNVAAEVRSLVKSFRDWRALQKMLGFLASINEQYGGADALRALLDRAAAIKAAEAPQIVVEQDTSAVDELRKVGCREMLSSNRCACRRTPPGSNVTTLALRGMSITAGHSRMQAMMQLKERVTSTEQELSGITDNIDELRAAGRMEAMQDLMQTVADSLVRLHLQLAPS
jgi:hypothetical protein